MQGNLLKAALGKSCQYKLGIRLQLVHSEIRNFGNSSPFMLTRVPHGRKVENLETKFGRL